MQETVVKKTRHVDSTKGSKPVKAITSASVITNNSQQLQDFIKNYSHTQSKMMKPFPYHLVPPPFGELKIHFYYLIVLYI